MRVAILTIILCLLFAVPAQAWQTFEATAYTHTGNQTYTGTWPKPGRTVAVDTNTIQLNSLILIKGLGWRIAEDKIPPRSVRKGAKIDIFMETKDKCWRWGRRDVKAIVITPDEIKEI